MILLFSIAWLMFGGATAWLTGRWRKDWSRWVSLFTFGVHLSIMISIWFRYLTLPGTSDPWILQLNLPWIPQLGINLHLGLDGLSILLVMLTDILGLMSVAASWEEIQYKVGFFHFNLLWIASALTGTLMALDLLLFYFFWELMLIPLYFLIGIWGHENRIYAALKFFIFTQFSSLLMLLSILGLYFIHGQSTGMYTFDYFALLGTAIAPLTAIWLMLGFFIAFGVKLPLVPLHTWLPDAHTEAPTAGSVQLAGLVLKMAAYGFIRFLIPLFPGAAATIAPLAMSLGVVGILYAAVLAFAQTDLKRLVAYTSISHMGFVLLGIFSWNTYSLQGAIILMLSHGISTGALFILVGELQERTHTRNLQRMGGLWDTAPKMGRVGLLFALASLGLPALGNFVGEFLILLGTYQTAPVFAILATLGFIVATVYSLVMVQRIFSGPNKAAWKFPDLNTRELLIMTVLIVLIFWLGLYPQPVLDTSQRSFDALRLDTQTVEVPEYLNLAAGSIDPIILEMKLPGMGKGW